MPDFLWSGEAWQFTLTNNTGITLTDCSLDVEPVGKTFLGDLSSGQSIRFYYNHDVTNVYSFDQFDSASPPERLTLTANEGTYTWE